MKRYPVGVDVTMDIPFLDLNGEPVTPTGLTVQVYDNLGNVVVQEEPVAFDPSDTYVTYTVPGSANQLGEGVPEGIFTAEIAVETASGTYRGAMSYQLIQSIRLFPPNNSFQPYENALLIAHNTLRMDSFKAASQHDQIVALRHAYVSLTRLAYTARVDLPDYPRSVCLNSYRDACTARHITPDMWAAMTQEYWGNLPVGFRNSLCEAQVIEANHLLTNDPVSLKQEAGILSESIGESSMMFRTRKPLDLGVSKAALRAISRYVNLKHGLTRV